MQEPASAHWSRAARARLWEARHEPDPGVTEAYDLAAIIDVDGSGVGHSAGVIDRGEGRSAPQETVTA